MSEQTRDRIREYYDRVLNGRELEAMGEFWADREKMEAVTRGCLTYFDSFPDLHIAVDELIVEDERVFVRSTMTGTHDGEYKGVAPTGRNVAAECAEVYRLSDGMIVGYWCLTNVAGLMRQLTEERVTTTA